MAQEEEEAVVTYIHNIDWYPVLHLHGWMFVTMAIHVSTTVTKFLFWKLKVGVMESFCSWKIEAQCSGLCCTLVQHKDAHVCLILEVVCRNLASFFSIRIWGLIFGSHEHTVCQWFSAIVTSSTPPLFWNQLDNEGRHWSTDWSLIIKQFDKVALLLLPCYFLCRGTAITSCVLIAGIWLW